MTHISDCVTLITMRLICKCYKNGLCNITDWSNKFIQVSCFKYFKALQLDIMAHNHSLIARYTRIELMIIRHNVALSCFKYTCNTVGKLLPISAQETQALYSIIIRFSCQPCFMWEVFRSMNTDLLELVISNTTDRVTSSLNN